jgi:hypothetical protein
MPAAAFTAVPASREKIFGEDEQAVFDIVVNAFDERFAGSRRGFLFFRGMVGIVAH